MNWLNMAVAGSGIVLAPFANIPELTSTDSIWRGFTTEGPVLYSSRIQKVSGFDCQSWIGALEKEALGTPYKEGVTSEAGLNFLEKAWAPWSKKELEMIQECTHSPCAVKLDKKEIESLSGKVKAAKVKSFLHSIQMRIKDYVKTKVHRGTEYPEPPFDSWEFFNQYKFISQNFSQEKSQIWMRKLDLGSNQAKILRQVLDRQIARPENGSGVTVRIRDVYTDHYFDSWGEWIQVQCDPNVKTQFMMIQVMALEFDLLKKTDLFSRLARGKMKSSLEKQSANYMDQRYERIKSRVTATMALRDVK